MKNQLHLASSLRRGICLIALFTALTNASWAASETDDDWLEVALSSYKYEEPGLMQLSGSKIGIGIHASSVNESQWITAFDARASFGQVDYNSADSGSDTGEPDAYTDLRVLTGQQFSVGDFRFHPFAGLGWRRLVNDSTNMITTTGHAGYRRISNYIYLPFGLDTRWNLADRRFIAATLELDLLLAGRQRSELPDETIDNRQTRGHGKRLSVMWGGPDFSIGPFLQTWRIGKSNEIDCEGGLSVCFEPANRTTEAGMRMRFSFR